MIGMMKIYLTRHATTNYNELGLCNDDSTVDVHLSKSGRLQANDLAEKLKEIYLDIIYVSELRRTQQTAVAINKYHNCKILVDARLNDNRTGFEGQSVRKFYDALQSSENRWTARFGDGESLEDTIERVRSFINELKIKDYNVGLIITSQSVVHAFYAITNNLSYEEAWKLSVENGSCLELDIN